MNYQQRKALGLILSAADRKEGEEIARMIKARTFETMGDDGWQRADRTPALAALVRTLVHGNKHTPADQLEQFYLYAEGSVSLPRGGRIWIRHNRTEPLTDAMRAAIKVHGCIDGRAIVGQAAPSNAKHYYGEHEPTGPRLGVGCPDCTTTRAQAGAATTEALGMLTLLIALCLVSFVTGLHYGAERERAENLRHTLGCEPGLVTGPCVEDARQAEYARVVAAIARTMRCSTEEERKAGRDHECDPSEIEVDAGLVTRDGVVIR